MVKVFDEFNFLIDKSNLFIFIKYLIATVDKVILFNTSFCTKEKKIILFWYSMKTIHSLIKSVDMVVYIKHIILQS